MDECTMLHQLYEFHFNLSALFAVAAVDVDFFFVYSQFWFMQTVYARVFAQSKYRLLDEFKHNNRFKVFFVDIYLSTYLNTLG